MARGLSPALAINLSRARRAAFWALVWERLWPHLVRLLTILGFFLASSWAGIWLGLSAPGRIAGLAVFDLALAAVLVSFARAFRLPAPSDVLQRLDREAGLAHRPATALTDNLAQGADPVAYALWQAHIRRTAAALGRLKVGQPLPRIARFDPWALRALALMLVAVTFIAADGERLSRISAAFDFDGVIPPANVRLDAWIAPPVYTGRPPVILAGDQTRSGSGDVLDVAEGSILVVRASGSDLRIETSGEIASAEAQKPPPAGVAEQRFRIAGHSSVRVARPSGASAWTFNTIPDLPPSITLVGQPERQAHGALRLSYKVEDDYGVTDAHATFAPREAMPRALFPALDMSLVLPRARAREGTGQTLKDLTEHPFAGATVMLTLTAKDEAGHEGRSNPIELRLPERVFSKPLARALIEQRRILALDAEKRADVATVLNALMLAPEIFTPEAGTYLGLHNVSAELDHASNDDALRGVVASLWALAISIEDGNLTDVEKALRAAQEALKEALERGASDEEIRKLTDRLRAAMDKFMRQLAEQALRNPQQLARPLDPNAKVMRPQDLRNMLDRLEQLSRNGDKDAARQMLEQLQAMLENLQMAPPGMAGREMQGAMNELSDIIRKQQQLRDRTFREGQEMRRERPRGTNPNSKLDGLQQDQRALKDRLDKLLDNLRKRGLAQQPGQQDQKGQQGQQGQQGKDSGSLGAAGEAMDEAGGQLGQGEADNALGSQGRALESLRNGAKSLAQSLQGQPGQGEENGGGDQVGRREGTGPDTDPLGRPLRQHSQDTGETSLVPGKDLSAAGRVGRILDELRRRLSDPQRPQIELDYLERLLKDE